MTLIGEAHRIGLVVGLGCWRGCRPRRIFFDIGARCLDEHQAIVATCQVVHDTAEQLRGPPHTFGVDQCSIIRGTMQFGEQAGRGQNRRNAAGEKGLVIRQHQGERSKLDVQLWFRIVGGEDLAEPRCSARAPHDKSIVGHTTDHVDRQDAGDAVQRDGGMVDEVPRADESSLLAVPQRKQNAAAWWLRQLGHRFGDFQHAGHTAGIVIGSIEHFRDGGGIVPAWNSLDSHVVVVCADDDGFLGQQGIAPLEQSQHVATSLFAFLHILAVGSTGQNAQFLHFLRQVITGCFASLGIGRCAPPTCRPPGTGRSPPVPGR